MAAGNVNPKITSIVKLHFRHGTIIYNSAHIKSFNLQLHGMVLILY